MSHRRRPSRAPSREQAKARDFCLRLHLLSFQQTNHPIIRAFSFGSLSFFYRLAKMRSSSSLSFLTTFILSLSFVATFAVAEPHAFSFNSRRRHAVNVLQRDEHLGKRFDGAQFTNFVDGVGACGGTNGPSDFVSVLYSVICVRPHDISSGRLWP